MADKMNTYIGPDAIQSFVNRYHALRDYNDTSENLIKVGGFFFSYVPCFMIFDDGLFLLFSELKTGV